jgi:sec-independent protein translocase protein TatA
MNIATFGNFFGADTLIIFLVILLLFGAKKLPELAKGMGQAVREFTKAKDEIEREVTRPPETHTPKQLEEPTFSQRPDPVDGETHGDIMHGETTPPSAKEPDSKETTHVS